MLINDPAKSTLVLRKYLKECKINPFFCHEISFKQSISALVKKRSVMSELASVADDLARGQKAHTNY